MPGPHTQGLRDGIAEGPGDRTGRKLSPSRLASSGRSTTSMTTSDSLAKLAVGWVSQPDATTTTTTTTAR